MSIRLLSAWRRRAVVSAAVAAGLFAAGATGNRAEAAYPERPIRLLVGFAPGGGNDILARFFAQRLQESLKQTVIVENRPGASGLLAVEAVRKATADGYTLLIAPSSSMTVNPVLIRNLPYDPRRDLAPVALLGRFPLVLVVPASSPVTTVGALVESARARPGALAFASASTSYRLATEMFAQAAGISLLHVPYKGSAPAIQAVVAGEVPLALADVATVMPFVKSGRLRALGVSTAQPTRTMPDTPPIAAQGVAGFDASVWAGLFAPPTTDAAVIRLLETELNRLAALPDVQQRLVELGIEPASSTARQLRDQIVREIDGYTRIAERAGIQPE